MSLLSRRSIVFRLWLRLSLITIAVALFALVAYVWVDVQDNISAAEARAHDHAAAVFAATQGLATNEAPPTQSQLVIANDLDAALVDVLDRNGTVTRSLGSLKTKALSQNMDPEVLKERIAGGPSRTEVQFDPSGSYAATQLHPSDMLNGGEYGVEYLFPLETSDGALRVVLTFPGVVHESQTLALRSLGLAGVIAGAMIFAMWILLNALVARPLRSYSDAAVRIARGEMVRMPAVIALDEMGHLGQAINGMADALGYQATVDPLTGLYNLRHLTSRLENLMDEAKLKREPLALIVLDLDNLKPINDTYGHPAGDLVLQAMSREMQSWAAEDYICWRTGGDEFAAALPGAGAEKAVTEALRLEKAIGSVSITLPNAVVHTSVSVGLALFPGDGDSVGSLLGTADRRMYEAKSDKAIDKRARRQPDSREVAA